MRGIRKEGLEGDRIERYKERRGKENWNAIGLIGLRKGGLEGDRIEKFKERRIGWR